MSLILNETAHWQMPDGGELHSGERIEVLLEGSWVAGRIEYRPRREYVLVLEGGEERAVEESLVLRPVERLYKM
ncbi:MAG TPA: DUF5348 domain-containing protein [Anaerolineaceae bacterium]